MSMSRTRKRAYRTIALTAFLSVISFASVALAQTGLDNPLNYDSIPLFIAGALKALAMIALPIITLFLVISGFYFITAQGSQDKLQKAKLNFFYVIIGALLILGAWILATLIAGTVSQLTSR